MEDIAVLDNSLYEMTSRIELVGETCGLKHSAEDPAENYLAVDYLCQNIGYNLKEGHHIDATLRIPICAECAEALLGDDWVLCYCVKCLSSQWICKRLSKLKFNDDVHVIWMDECPNCMHEKEESINK